jgi:hypothetical protein
MTDKTSMAKSIVAAVVTGLGSVQVALADGHITASEWAAAAVATLGALAAVWATTNKSKGAEVADDLLKAVADKLKK